MSALRERLAGSSNCYLYILQVHEQVWGNYGGERPRGCWGKSVEESWNDLGSWDWAKGKITAKVKGVMVSGILDFGIQTGNSQDKHEISRISCFVAWNVSPVDAIIDYDVLE